VRAGHFPRPRELRPGADSRLTRELREPDDPAPVQHRAGARENRGQQYAQLGNRTAGERCGVDIEADLRAQEMNVEALVDECLDLVAPRRRSRPNAEQLILDCRSDRSQRGQQLVANAIAKVSERRVARILHPFDPARLCVRLDLRPANVEQRAKHRPRRGETGKPASPRASKCSHEHGLDLIVGGMRGNDTASNPRGHII
jgi:hypothetical protein